MIHKATTSFILGLVISLFAWGCSAPDLLGPPESEPITFTELGECRDSGGTVTVINSGGSNQWFCTRDGPPAF